MKTQEDQSAKKDVSTDLNHGTNSNEDVFFANEEMKSEQLVPSSK